MRCHPLPPNAGSQGFDGAEEPACVEKPAEVLAMLVTGQPRLAPIRLVQLGVVPP
jgi:hypothetical protein